MGKLAVLLLIAVLAASNLLVVGSVFAESIPEPSVPEFTAQLADHSYDVPPTTTTTTNPYNNETITKTKPGYHIQNITIDLTIKNQPYPKIINGNESFVYFNVRTKPGFGDEWTELYPYYSSSPVQSNSDYTVISLPTKTYEIGYQIDIQVQAAIGYKFRTFGFLGHIESVDFQHKSSDWSNTQTITIEEIQTSPEPTATSTPFDEPQLGQDIFLGVAVIVAVIIIGLGLLVHLIKKQ